MSDNGSNMQPVRPLTRREIREREQADAAQRSAQSAGDGAPASWAAPPAQPAAAPAGPPPSRRSLRETTGPAEQPSQPSVVRPPSMSGGMRGMDETGRLTPVQETAERVMVRPPANPTPPPTRTSSRPAAGMVTRAPGASGPVRPPTPVRGGAGAAGAVPVARISARNPQEATAPAQQPQPQPQPQRLSAFSAPPISGQTTTPPPGTPTPAPATSPWSSGPMAAAAPPVVPQRPAAPPEPAQDTSVAPLPWSAITSGGAPERATPAAATPAPDDLFPRVHAGRDDTAPDADEAEAEDVRGPSYTWLHYLILVAVAFVLGLLVWKLISSDTPGPSSAASVVVVDPSVVASTDPPGVVR